MPKLKSELFFANWPNNHTSGPLGIQPLFAQTMPPASIAQPIALTSQLAAFKHQQSVELDSRFAALESTLVQLLAPAQSVQQRPGQLQQAVSATADHTGWLPDTGLPQMCPSRGGGAHTWCEGKRSTDLAVHSLLHLSEAGVDVD